LKEEEEEEEEKNELHSETKRSD